MAIWRIEPQGGSILYLCTMGTQSGSHGVPGPDFCAMGIYGGYSQGDHGGSRAKVHELRLFVLTV